MSSSFRKLARGQLYSCPVFFERLALCRGVLLSVTRVNANADDHAVLPGALTSKEESSGMEGGVGGEKLRNEIVEIIDFNMSSILLIWNSSILKQDYWGWRG